MGVAPVEKELLSPPQLARKWGIAPYKVYKFIAAGELPAINMSSPGAKKIHLRVERHEAEAFLRRRAVNAKLRRPKRHVERRRAGDRY
jgi:hypothetical protein